MLGVIEMDNESMLKSNLMIVFSDLEKAIEQYVSSGYSIGETKYIDAYLAATIHALMDYADAYLSKDDEKIQACRYANNTLKHNSLLKTHRTITGGLTFPFCFPMRIEKLEIVWNYDCNVETRYKSQQRAFETHFAGKPILETLRPILQQIKENE